MTSGVLILALSWPMWLVWVITFLFLGVSVLMVLTVLIQRPQGGGLASAFGAGAGSGQTAFGAKTGDALTIFTIIVFVVYLFFAVVLNYGARSSSIIGGKTESAIEGSPAPEGGSTPPATAPGVTPPPPTPTAPEGAPASPPAGGPGPEGGSTPPPTPPPTTTPTGG